MLEIQVRPTHQLLQLIARLERLSGRWDALQDVKSSDPQDVDWNLLTGSLASLWLNPTTPSPLSLTLRETQSLYIPEKNSPVTPYTLAELQEFHPAIEASVSAHRLEFTLSSSGLNYLHQALLSQAEPTGFRRESYVLTSPEHGSLFTTASAFLIEQRLSDLLLWTDRELRSGIIHPLIVIGAFHLLFLHISPYAIANHRLSLLLLWHLLMKNGYSFVQHAHFTPLLCARSWDYCSSLMQAEKSVYSNWSTIRAWLDFFVAILNDSCQALIKRVEQRVAAARLTDVQRRIVEVVEVHGAATRERIVRDSGINLATVKYNLSVLTTRGQLRRNGGGRTTSYSLLPQAMPSIPGIR